MNVYFSSPGSNPEPSLLPSLTVISFRLFMKPQSASNFFFFPHRMSPLSLFLSYSPIRNKCFRFFPPFNHDDDDEDEDAPRVIMMSLKKKKKKKPRCTDKLFFDEIPTVKQTRKWRSLHDDQVPEDRPILSSITLLGSLTSLALLNMGVDSHLTPTVPGMDSGSTLTLSRMKHCPENAFILNTIGSLNPFTWRTPPFIHNLSA